MEVFKVIKHTNGDDKCLMNVVNYPIGKDQPPEWRRGDPASRPRPGEAGRAVPGSSAE